MKPKKWIRMFCVISIVGMMASAITGCQTNTAEKTTEETTEETTSMDNNGYVTSTGEPMPYTPMDACLNLDLDMFTVLGKPIGDWTYEELCDYIIANYVETGVCYDPSTGAQGRSFVDDKPTKTSMRIMEGQYIEIDMDGVTYRMKLLDWCRSNWDLSSNNPESDDIVASICGQHIESYLETICPGLYDKLLEEPTVYLKDGAAMMDDATNGSQRISLLTLDGNLDLSSSDGVIDVITVIFIEQQQFLCGGNLGENQVTQSGNLIKQAFEIPRVHSSLLKGIHSGSFFASRKTEFNF